MISSVLRDLVTIFVRLKPCLSYLSFQIPLPSSTHYIALREPLSLLMYINNVDVQSRVN